jgi:hypothetical protein
LVRKVGKRVKKKIEEIGRIKRLKVERDCE